MTDNQTDRRYNPSPKHKPGGWGTIMDLDDDTARDVLDNAIEVPGKKQLIAVYNGRIYVFQPENEGLYHGYPVSGAEILEKYPKVARGIAQQLGISVKKIKEVE